MFTFQSEEHAREIQAWHEANDRDSQPMPEPCTTTWCNFCQNWYGRDFNRRRAVWERRNAEQTKARLAAFRATHPHLFEVVEA